MPMILINAHSHLIIIFPIFSQNFVFDKEAPNVEAIASIVLVE